MSRRLAADINRRRRRTFRLAPVKGKAAMPASDIARTAFPPMRIPAALAAAICMLLTTTGQVAAEPAQAASAGAACAGLSGKVIDGVALATALIPASGATPTFCKVTGTIPPELDFEIRLPDAWNGKLYYGGGGGYDGAVTPVITPPLAQGYAEVVSNGGHRGDGMSAEFAAKSPRAAELFGSQSVPTVMAIAPRAIAAAYGAAPSRSYFEGCSNGGREALMAVQRHPQLFDGVIARAPAYNWVGLIGAFHRTARALAAPGGAFTPAKTSLLAWRVREVCDGLDGVVDGVVANPRACTARRLKLVSLRCRGGRDTGDRCLSDAQLAVLRAWTTDVRFHGAKPYVSRGYNLTGNEDDPMGFGVWVSGDGDVRKAGQYILQDTTAKAYLARNPDARSGDDTRWDRDPGALDALAALNDATDPDIRPFIDKGGKLILWHGGADAALSVNSTIDYVKTMRRTVGPARAAAATRFYVAPGVNHCEGGAGPDQTDLLKALDAWVSSGIAPETLVARKLDAGGAVVRSMPLCPYPQYPRHVGAAGDKVSAQLAQTYVCSTP